MYGTNGRLPPRVPREQVTGSPRIPVTPFLRLGAGRACIKARSRQPPPTQHSPTTITPLSPPTCGPNIAEYAGRLYAEQSRCESMVCCVWPCGLPKASAKRSNTLDGVGTPLRPLGAPWVTSGGLILSAALWVSARPVVSLPYGCRQWSISRRGRLPLWAF